jgi:hypothetical protein
VVEGFTISNGYGDERGGGIYCDEASPTIRRNIIENCYSFYGGGIMVWSGAPFIVSNTITDNESDQGGGIGCQYYSSPDIIDNIIIRNHANSYGGGIRCSYSTVLVKGNVIYGNSAYWGGGVYSNNNPASTILNNTILENTASNGGSGVMINYSSPTVKNCIVRDNDYDQIFLRGSSYPTIEYCNVEDGWPEEGNIDADPTFVLPEKRDYRLLWESPCIDTGDPAYFDEDDTRSDIGAHFFDQDDYLTVYMTPETREAPPGSQVGVTYTLINRWPQKEPFEILGIATNSAGKIYNILGPEAHTICATYTVQEMLFHDVAPCAHGIYEYQCTIGLPPSTVYDRDSFRIWIVE